VPYNSNSSSTSTYGTSGTLGSQGLAMNPAIPRNSQARGIQGTDERAYTRRVGADELVENRIGGLMNRGGAYMQNARRRGMEEGMSRGLGLSSISAGASERAGLEAAMPIAQADAAAYGRAQTENMGALNQNLMQQRDIMNQQTMEGSRLAQAGAEAASRERIAMTGYDVDLQRQRENLAFGGEQAQLDRAQQLGMSLQQYQQQLGLGQQGYQFDLGRMGAQDYYSGLQGQRDTLNQASLAEYGAGLNAMNRYYGNMADDFFTNPEVYQDPYARQAVLDFGQNFLPQFTSMFTSMYGRPGG